MTGQQIIYLMLIAAERDVTSHSHKGDSMSIRRHDLRTLDELGLIQPAKSVEWIITSKGKEYIKRLFEVPTTIVPVTAERRYMADITRIVIDDLVKRLSQNDDAANQTLSDLIAVADNLSPAKPVAVQTPGMFETAGYSIALDHVSHVIRFSGGIGVHMIGESVSMTDQADIDGFMKALRQHNAYKHTSVINLDAFVDVPLGQPWSISQQPKPARPTDMASNAEYHEMESKYREAFGRADRLARIIRDIANAARTFADNAAETADNEPAA